MSDLTLLPQPRRRERRARAQSDEAGVLYGGRALIQPFETLAGAALPRWNDRGVMMRDE
jgi:hypothetical protein